MESIYSAVFKGINYRIAVQSKFSTEDFFSITCAYVEVLFHSCYQQYIHLSTPDGIILKDQKRKMMYSKSSVCF